MRIEVGTIYEFVTKTNPKGPLALSKRHPFAVLEYDGETAVCCMITHTKPSTRYPFNKLMHEDYFERRADAKGVPFEYNPDNPSYFLIVRLIKPADYFNMDATRITGKLSHRGVSEILRNKKNVEPMTWQEYVTRYCSQL